MRYINTVEKTLSAWHLGLPHLPTKARAWIVENMWWMALVTVIVLVCGMFLLIPLLFTALALAPTVNIVTPNVPYYQTVLGSTWVGLTVFVVSFLIASILIAMAVGMLREKLRHGWNLVFYALLIFFVLNIVAALLMYNMFVLLGVVVDAFIGYYLLFEVRSDLMQKHHPIHKKNK